VRVALGVDPGNHGDGFRFRLGLWFRLRFFLWKFVLVPLDNQFKELVSGLQGFVDEGYDLLTVHTLP